MMIMRYPREQKCFAHHSVPSLLTLMVRIRIKPDLGASGALSRPPAWSARRQASREDHLILCLCFATCLAFLIPVIPRTTLFIVAPLDGRAPALVGPYRHWEDTGWVGRG